MDKCKKAYIEWVNNVPLFYCSTTKEMCPYGRYCTNELIPKMGGNYIGCVELNRVEVVENVSEDVVEAIEEVVVKPTRSKTKEVAKE